MLTDIITVPNTSAAMNKCVLQAITSELNFYYLHFYGRYSDDYGREYNIDRVYNEIVPRYEKLIALQSSEESKLEYYIYMLSECDDVFYDEIHSKGEPLLFEKDLCGGDGSLLIDDPEPVRKRRNIELFIKDAQAKYIIEKNNSSDE